jgi:hypothetical protein
VAVTPRILSTMIARVSSALLLLLVCSNLVAAEVADTTGADQGPVWIDPGWRRTVRRYAVSFDEQGLSTTVFDFEIQALDEKGVQAISQQTIAYNSYFDDLVSSDLATVKADGRVIVVDERAIHDQPASADSSSPYFDEQRQRIIAYSNVAPGDKVRGRLIYRATGVCRRVRALLEPSRGPAARGDGADPRRTGVQAAPYRTSGC